MEGSKSARNSELLKKAYQYNRYMPRRCKNMEVDGVLWSSRTTKRYESWALLRYLRLFTPKLWLCLGDFNEIVAQGEKSGASLRREGQREQS